MKNYNKIIGILGLAVLLVSPAAFAQAAGITAISKTTALPILSVKTTASPSPILSIAGKEPAQSVRAWGVITAIGNTTVTFATGPSAKTAKTFVVNIGSAQIQIGKGVASSSALGVGMQGYADGTWNVGKTIVNATFVRVTPVTAWGTVTAVNGNTITFQNGKGKTWQVNDASAQVFVSGKVASSSSIIVGMKGSAEGGWTDNTKVLLNATTVKVREPKVE